MGQSIRRGPEAPAVDAARAAREPIGRYLAQQRRLRGIELEDLAARTRIPRRSLERLEAGAFDHSPDGFSRGFVRTVAEAIGVDPDDAVARMLPEPDAARTRTRRPGRALGAIAAVVAVAGVALGANELASRILMRGGAAMPANLPVRRDYVRELAEAEGIRTAALGPSDAQLAPLPPEPTAPAIDAALASSAAGASDGAATSDSAAGEPRAAASPTPSQTAAAPAAGAAARAAPGQEGARAAARAERPAPRSESTAAPAPPASAANGAHPSAARPAEQTRGGETVPSPDLGAGRSDSATPVGEGAAGPAPGDVADAANGRGADAEPAAIAPPDAEALD